MLDQLRPSSNRLPVVENTLKPAGALKSAGAQKPAASSTAATGLKYKNGMWYQNGRVVRGPSIRALKANLKKRGVDAVRDSLGNAYGPIDADDFIERSTGYKATDPLLSEAVKNYKVQTSNPTISGVYRPDFAAAESKARAYGNTLRKRRLEEAAARYPDIVDDLLGQGTKQRRLNSVQSMFDTASDVLRY